MDIKFYTFFNLSKSLYFPSPPVKKWCIHVCTSKWSKCGIRRVLFRLYLPYRYYSYRYVHTCNYIMFLLENVTID